MVALWLLALLPSLAARPLEQPEAPADLLSVGEGWSVELEQLGLGWDASEDGSRGNGLQARARADWERAVDWTDTGWWLQAEVDAEGQRTVDRPPEGDSTTESRLDHEIALEGERRRYLTDGAFFLATAGRISSDWNRDDGETTSLDTGFHPRAGVGWGRLLHRSEQLRLEWLERLLDEAGCLVGPIPADTAAEIRWAWFQHRTLTGSSRRLLATLDILRRDGLLRREPSPLTTYRLVNLLNTTTLSDRWEGSQLSLLGGYDLTMRRDEDDPQGLRAQATWTWQRPIDERRHLGISAHLAAGFDTLTVPVTSLGARTLASWTRYFMDPDLHNKGHARLSASLTWGSTLGSQDSELLLQDRWISTRTLPLSGDGKLLEAQLSAYLYKPISRAAGFSLGSSVWRSELGSDDATTHFFVSAGVSIGQTTGWFGMP